MTGTFRKKTLYFIIAAYMLLMFVFSVMPIEMPALINVLDPKKVFFHFAEFAVLGFMLFSASYKKAGSFAAAGAYGLLLELVQGILPYRTMDIYDIAANIAGAGAGIIIGAAVRRLR